jgi:hypothetical protein
MTSSSKRISPITMNLSAIPAGIPRHMSYRPNEPKPEDKQPTWYTFIEAQEWNPAPASRTAAASDAWGATTNHMMTRMDTSHEGVSGNEPTIDGLAPPRLPVPARKPAPRVLPPVPSKAHFDVAPVAKPVPVPAPVQPRNLPVRVASPASAKNDRAQANAVHFVREALKPETNHTYGTSTVADRTENLPAADPLNAGEEVMNALRGLCSKLPMKGPTKRKQAAEIAAFLRNKDFVGFDEKGNDRVQRRFTNDSKKLDWAGIRQRFPGISDESVANLTSTLARVWQYQDLGEEWLNDEPSMTAAVFKALNDNKPSQS